MHNIDELLAERKAALTLLGVKRIMGKWTDAAQIVRDSMDYAGTFLTDADASKAIPLYPMLKQDGSLVKAGTRIQWNGTLKRAATDLWDTVENDPDHAPALWEDIHYKDGIRIIPAVITAGTAFTKDELGWWGDVIYRSKVGANVYTPEQYPANWEVYE